MLAERQVAMGLKSANQYEVCTDSNPRFAKTLFNFCKQVNLTHTTFQMITL